jgi:PPK2 family polyphosphate:nucleotide phosphotransferase
LSGTNPQGVNVTGFKHPTEEEMAHDFLWRAHRHTPAHGEIMIFNRSHYEDVLAVRVHNIVPKSVWSSRYDRIREFEHLLTEGGTHVLKFYLHVSPEEQLARFKDRLDDPQRNWKIRDSDYTEREHWPAYIEAFEDAIGKTTTARAPWYIIPSNHKWFRNLVVSSILVNTLEDMNLQTPKPSVDLKAIRRRYHSAKLEQKATTTSSGFMQVKRKTRRLRTRPEKTARERLSGLHLLFRATIGADASASIRLVRDDHWAQSHWPAALVGYGDPIFSRGKPSSQRTANMARSTRTRAYSSFWRGSRADLDALAQGLAPLPETANELKTVAKTLGAPAGFRSNSGLTADAPGRCVPVSRPLCARSGFGSKPVLPQR